jgi:hypothetical protein
MRALLLHCCHPDPSSHRERLVRLNTGSSTIHALIHAHPGPQEGLLWLRLPMGFNVGSSCCCSELRLWLHRATGEEHFPYASIRYGLLCTPPFRVPSLSAPQHCSCPWLTSQTMQPTASSGCSGPGVLASGESSRRIWSLKPDAAGFINRPGCCQPGVGGSRDHGRTTWGAEPLYQRAMVDCFGISLGVSYPRGLGPCRLPVSGSLHMPCLLCVRFNQARR